MLLYYIAKLSNNEDKMRRIGQWYEERAEEKAKQISDDMKCEDCPYSRLTICDSDLVFGFMCKINPLNPIYLRRSSKHLDREKVLKEQI